MSPGCLQRPRKQEVPSRPMPLGVKAASPESSVGCWEWCGHPLLQGPPRHLAVWMSQDAIDVCWNPCRPLSEEFAIHSIWGDTYVSRIHCRFEADKTHQIGPNWGQPHWASAPSPYRYAISLRWNSFHHCLWKMMNWRAVSTGLQHLGIPARHCQTHRFPIPDWTTDWWLLYAQEHIGVFFLYFSWKPGGWDSSLLVWIHMLLGGAPIWFFPIPRCCWESTCTECTTPWGWMVSINTPLHERNPSFMPVFKTGFAHQTRGFSSQPCLIPGAYPQFLQVKSQFVWVSNPHFGGLSHSFGGLNSPIFPGKTNPTSTRARSVLQRTPQGEEGLRWAERSRADLLGKACTVGSYLLSVAWFPDHANAVCTYLDFKWFQRIVQNEYRRVAGWGLQVFIVFQWFSTILEMIGWDDAYIFGMA